jgi:hypothetical protein
MLDDQVRELPAGQRLEEEGARAVIGAARGKLARDKLL